MLHKELTEHSSELSSEHSSEEFFESSEIFSKKCDKDGIGHIYEKENRRKKNFFEKIEMDSDLEKFQIRCECFTGDIIKHEVNKLFSF